MPSFIDLFSNQNLSFQNPEWLWLLLLVPLLALWQWRRETTGKTAAVRYSNLAQMKQTKQRGVKAWRHSVTVLRLLALAFLTVALARPRLANQKQSVYAEGIDIMLALDLSRSMLAEDFDPKNRIEAAKEVAIDFVRNRISDRIGLVVFAGKSFMQCPPTLDYELLIRFIQDLSTDRIEEIGTSIGTAIAAATNALRGSTSKSKLIVLLTDGQNNTGEIEPVTAAELARAVGIRMYTVGAGTRGFARYPTGNVFSPYMMQPVDVDDSTLARIAAMTGGRYFRATDLQSLRRTYADIDKLEKTKVEVQNYVEYREEFILFLAPALLLLALELILANTRFRKIP